MTPPPWLTQLQATLVVSTWEPATGKCGAIDSYNDVFESDIEKLLTNKKVIPNKLTEKKKRCALQNIAKQNKFVTTDWKKITFKLFLFFQTSEWVLSVS